MIDTYEFRYKLFIYLSTIRHVKMRHVPLHLKRNQNEILTYIIETLN